MVKVYELKSIVAFENGDFFTLQNDDKKILIGDILAVDEFIFRPGDTQFIRRRADTKAVAIGVLAGYRDLGKSVWRAVYRLPPAPDNSWYRTMMPRKKIKLKIGVGQQAVLITELEL